MVRASRYWQILKLTSSGNCEAREIPAARKLVQNHCSVILADPSVTDSQVQQRLWEMGQPDAPDVEAALLAKLCLRCWISHQIGYVCRQLAAQFGETYGFSALELWPLVLDDDGQLEPTYPSVAVTILDSYDPTKAALGTWVARRTRDHPEVTRFCINLGFYRISDWAILNDTQVAQLPRFLNHLSQGELQTATWLLDAYHRVYRRARLMQRQRGYRGRCAEPTVEQLKQIAPGQSPSEVLNQLQDLAYQLRQYRIAVRRGTPLIAQSLDQPDTAEVMVIDELDDESTQTQHAFMERYRVNFLASLDEAIKHVVQNYAEQYRRRKPPKDEIFLQALKLFHCQGLAMKEIAAQTGLSSQVQVTRLLQLKRFRADVCVYWLNRLKTEVQADALQHITPEQLDGISSRLDQSLTEDTESVMAEAASEAQIPKNRTVNSVFARRLCAMFSSLDEWR